MAISEKERRGHGISLLVPFRVKNNTDRRAITWNWLREYWAYELPEAEVVIGSPKPDVVFSKTVAVNNAAKKAHGDIFVILDADCYIPGSVIVDCATQIREARTRDQRLWFMPYRRFWRLTEEISQLIIDSDPRNPRQVLGVMPTIAQLDAAPDRPYHRPHRRPHHHRPRKGDVESNTSSGESPLIEARGHWYGALIQIMPREAFFMTGGMDERFAGWGGEDVSFMHAVDTLYARHRTTPNGVFHLWHPLAQDRNFNRLWPGQDKAGTNGRLATRYGVARNDYDRMRNLVNEHPRAVEWRNVYVRTYKRIVAKLGTFYRWIRGKLLWLKAKLQNNFRHVCALLASWSVRLRSRKR